MFEHTGGPNSKEEGRGDMAGLKRTYDMMDVGISRVPPIRDSLPAAEGEHKTPFFNKNGQQSSTVYPFSPLTFFHLLSLSLLKA